MMFAQAGIIYKSTGHVYGNLKYMTNKSKSYALLQFHKSGPNI